MANSYDPNNYYNPHDQQSINDQWGDANQQGDGIIFDMETNHFGQDQQQFQSFDYTDKVAPDTTHSGGNFYALQQGYAPFNGSIAQAYNPSHNQFLNPNDSTFQQSSEGSTVFDDEPPLLEELGIKPDHIFQKTLSVLNPLRETDAAILQDTDLAGPLAFVLAFGGFLLLSGKIHFSYIYGIGVLGCMAIYVLLNLMAVSGVSVGVTISVLGYCLLPMVALSGISILVSLQGMVGIGLTATAILWCSLSASKLFVTALTMDQQQPLVAYPCALFYGVFALLTIF